MNSVSAVTRNVVDTTGIEPVTPTMSRYMAIANTVGYLPNILCLFSNFPCFIADSVSVKQEVVK